jgi:hypothetical protein
MTMKATKLIRIPEDLHHRLPALSMESGKSIISLATEFILAGLTSSKSGRKKLPRTEGKQEIQLKEKIVETFVRLGKMKKEDVIRKRLMLF